MIRKQVRFIADNVNGKLYVPVTYKSWDAAQRIVNRCRRGLIKLVVVTERELSMKLDGPVTGSVF